MRSVLFVLVLLLFGGCAKYVETDISVYHELKPPLSGESYVLVPSDEQAQSLEFQSYAAMVKSQLGRYGMVEHPYATAKYAVYLSYGVESGKQIVSSYPVYGQTGLRASFATGRVVTRDNRSRLVGVTYYTPMYGMVGTETRSSLVFPVYVNLDITEKAGAPGGAERKVYEARVLSYGETGVLSPIMPAIIRSLFKDFPGVNGTFRKSREPLEEQ